MLKTFVEVCGAHDEEVSIRSTTLSNVIMLDRHGVVTCANTAGLSLYVCRTEA